MAEQNELPVVADVFTMQALVPGERAVHYSRLLVEVPRGTKLTDHATATARIASLEAQLEEVRKDARRYQIVRRGQHWSVIDGIGNELRAEKLDDAADSAIKAADGGGNG